MIIKLLKTAFWLGIVIYNLPSQAPPSAASSKMRPGALQTE